MMPGDLVVLYFLLGAVIGILLAIAWAEAIR